MALKQGMRIERGYATVAAEEGDNYREIAEIMTLMGYPMNHSSARNHILRIMVRFAQALTQAYGHTVDAVKLYTIARNPSFQSGICDILQQLEARRRLTAV